MKKIVVIFGTKEYEGTIELLLRSIEHMVDDIFVYTPNNIGPEFRRKNRFILSHKRGFGYWIWKPYIILDAMTRISNNDICFYLDAGVIATNDISPLFDDCNIYNILLFNNRCGNPNGDIWINKYWTKKDCFRLMDCVEDKYINGNQVEASFQLYKKTEFAMTFLSEYLHFCENETVVTDVPSIEIEDERFVEHRHDQSILSLLSIKHNIHTEDCLTQWGEHVQRRYGTLFYQHKQKIELKHCIPTQLPSLYQKHLISS